MPQPARGRRRQLPGGVDLGGNRLWRAAAEPPGAGAERDLVRAGEEVALLLVGQRPLLLLLDLVEGRRVHVGEGGRRRLAEILNVDTRRADVVDRHRARR